MSQADVPCGRLVVEPSAMYFVDTRTSEMYTIHGPATSFVQAFSSAVQAAKSACPPGALAGTVQSAHMPAIGAAASSRATDESERLMRTVRITNLPPSMKVKNLLKDLVHTFGQVGRYSIEMDATTETPFATIEFMDVFIGMKATGAGTFNGMIIRPSPTVCHGGAPKDTSSKKVARAEPPPVVQPVQPPPPPTMLQQVPLQAPTAQPFPGTSIFPPPQLHMAPMPQPLMPQPQTVTPPVQPPPLAVITAQLPLAQHVASEPPRLREECVFLKRTIRITNLSPSLKVKKLLKDLVQEFGEVGRYSVEMDSATQAPIATIEFISIDAAAKATNVGHLGTMKLLPSPVRCLNGEVPKGVSSKTAKERDRTRSPPPVIS